MKRILASVACTILLCPSSLASDWVEDEDILPVQQMPQSVPSVPVMTKEDDSESILFNEEGEAGAPMGAAIAPALTLPQELSSLELSLLDRTYSDDGILRRIQRLEDKAQMPSNGNILERVQRLREQIPTSEQNRAVARKPQGNTFLNPSDVPWLNALGRGARATGRGILNSGRSVDDTASSVLSSPEFWGLAVGLGAGIPLAMMANRGIGNCYYGYGNPGFPSCYANPYGYSPVMNFGGSTGTLISAPGSSSLFNPSFASMPSIQRVGGYTNRFGTYVAPYYRTRADGNPFNNWSTFGNTNPFNGRRGYRRFPF